MTKRNSLRLVLLAAAMLLGLAAGATTWPASNSDWHVTTIGGALIWDALNDANGSRNTVGDPSNGTAYIYVDTVQDKIFFRLRLDSDPTGTGGQGKFQSYGWGVEIDTNKVNTDYEWMVNIDGISGTEPISLRQNTIQKNINDPSDVAEVVRYSEISSNGVNYRVVTADTSFNSDPDYFLDWCLPYSTFKQYTGLTDNSPIRVFFGSSSSANALTENGADLVGSSTLSGGFSDYITPLGTVLATATIMFVSDLTGAGDETQVAAGNPVYIKVTDLDRNVLPGTIETVTIRLTSGSGDVQETLTLTETGVNTGIFTGTINTQDANPVLNDGIMQVTYGGSIRARYIDIIDGNANSYVPIYDVIDVTGDIPATGNINWVESDTYTDIEYILPGKSVYLRVDDEDLNTNSTTAQTVNVSVVTGAGDTETFTLTETGVNTGIFVNTSAISTSHSSPSSSNGVLNVAYGEQVTATYVDALDTNSTGPYNRTDSFIVRSPVTGTVRFVSALDGSGDVTNINAGNTLYIRVDDADLNTNSLLRQTITVALSSPLSSGTDDETLTLTETGEDTGIFTGTIGTTVVSSVDGDGVLQAIVGNTITVTYVDALDALGNTNQNRTDTVNVIVVHFTGTITFTKSDASGDITFIYVGDGIYVTVVDNDLNTGSTSKQKLDVYVKSLTTNDQVKLTLNETDNNTGIFINTAPLPTAAGAAVTNDTTLQVQVGETVYVDYTDANDADNNINQLRTDTLIVRTYQTGSIMFVSDIEGNGDETEVRPYQNLYIKVIDGDLNTDGSILNEVSVTLTSNASPTGESQQITLTETGINTGIFTALLPTTYNTTVTQNNGSLELVSGQIVTATYNETKNASGNPQSHTDTINVLGNITGTVTFVDSAYTADVTAIDPNDTIYIKVVDGDLDAQSDTIETVTVTITSATTGDDETVTLTETAVSSGIFTGQITTTIAAADDGNGSLQTQEGETVTVTYVDAHDAAFNVDQNRTDSLVVNDITYTGTVRFVTSDYTTDLTSISPGDTIYVRVTDGDLNTNTLSADSATATITTSSGDTLEINLTETGLDTGVFTASVPTVEGSPAADGNLQVTNGDTVTVTYNDNADVNGTPQAPTDTLTVGGATTGIVTFYQSGYTADLTRIESGDTIYVQVSDGDRNANPLSAETVTVTITSTTGDSEVITLTETGVNTGIFRASLPSANTAGAFNDGTLQVSKGDVVVVTYIDLEDANGNFNQNRYDTLVVNSNFDLRPDRTGSVSPGGTVTYEHTLENYSDLGNRFYLTITGGTASFTYVLYDTNNPGSPLPRDAGHGNDYYIDLDPAGGSTPSATFYLRIWCPTNVTLGTTDVTSITATPRDHDWSQIDTAVDITIVQAGDLQLTKAVSPTGAIKPGETLTYTTEIFNKSTGALTDVIVRDQIPANTTWVTGQLSAAFTGITVTLEVSTDDGATWLPSSYTPGAPVTSVRARLQAPLPSGTKGTMTFQVTVD